MVIEKSVHLKLNPATGVQVCKISLRVKLMEVWCFGILV